VINRTTPPQHALLSRETLSRVDFHEYISAVVPGIKLLSQDVMDRSMHRTLDERPVEGDGVWIFGYGSLLWDSPLVTSEQQVVTVTGWQRAFCLHAIMGRGSPERPGLTLALDVGGQCTGVAFHIDERDLTRELKILWRREMSLGTYRPRWVESHNSEGALIGPTLAFAADPNDSAYVGDLSYEEVVASLGTGSGALGSTADYLFHTQSRLRDIGITDLYINDLVRSVEATGKP
jgi:glutathione-specific gamma-glutamylcyclotransferase